MKIVILYKIINLIKIGKHKFKFSMLFSLLTKSIQTRKIKTTIHTHYVQSIR